MSSTKRKKYDASFKLKVVNFAMEHNNCAAARQYGVTEKMVRDWKSNEKALKSMPRGKCALRRGAPHWPELKKHVADMVAQHRQNGYVVTRNTIRLFALQWAKSNPDHSNNFKATISWCSRFMARHDLVLRQKTKIAQKLPADLDNKVDSFHQYVIQQRTKHGYALSNIGNMDETLSDVEFLLNDEEIENDLGVGWDDRVRDLGEFENADVEQEGGGDMEMLDPQPDGVVQRHRFNNVQIRWILNIPQPRN
uniref:HTH CENPB-type domain-containing protein n=1 Tax=Paramormyrops kingsleyae TaxID=1676925 RepID=A0A3B3TFI6_9TELE